MNGIFSAVIPSLRNILLPQECPEEVQKPLKPSQNHGWIHYHRISWFIQAMLNRSGCLNGIRQAINGNYPVDDTRTERRSTMTNPEKIALLEETWELDEGTLTEDTVLADLDEFDSMGKLSLIVLCDDEFGKKLPGETIKTFKTVKDILDFMG